MIRMHKKGTLFAALVVALVLGVAAMAMATSPLPTLTATKAVVIYPHTAALVSVTDTPSVLMKRVAGTDEWVKVVDLAAGNATTSVMPTATAGYKVVSDAVESDVVTISVKAQMQHPQVSGKFRRRHSLLVKGWIAPLHSAGASVLMTFQRWEKVTTTVTIAGKGKGKSTVKKIIKYQWVRHGNAVSVPLVRKNSLQSKYAYKFTPGLTGKWRIVVAHEDTEHVRNAVTATAQIKR